MQFASRFLRRGAPEILGDKVAVRPQPTRKLVVIGDVHGRHDLFGRLLARIWTDHPEAEVIQVGDLIDRGEDSAAVLRLAFAQRHDLRVVIGNHEEMLIAFLDDPEGQAGRWFRYGGLQTMASFGIGPIGAAPDAAACSDLRDRLRAAMGPRIEDWLRALPRVLYSGNVAVTHARTEPRHLLETPDAAAPAWVVHGHTIVAEGCCADGVIAVDTGAFASGRLTAAVLAQGRCDFLVETS